MKAFKGSDQQVRLFRPWLNMDRMLRSALRLCLPVRGRGWPPGVGGVGGEAQGFPLTHGNPAQSFDKVELLECIRRLVEVDKDWVPDDTNASLYVRPVIIGNEVGLTPARDGCGAEGGGSAEGQRWELQGRGRGWAGGLDSWVPDRKSTRLNSSH